MRNTIRRLLGRCRRFAEEQGFLIVTAACVAVITATALYAQPDAQGSASPTLPPQDPVSAARLLQESLAEAAATPAPTAAPPRWSAPLGTAKVLRAFDCDALLPMDSGLWALHDAVDLICPAGSPVYAIADGEVLSCGRDALQGAWITLRHAEGIVSHYAGLESLRGLAAGDAVQQGDVLGLSGNTMAEEASLGPHLHLRVTKDGQAIDPINLWVAQAAE